MKLASPEGAGDTVNDPSSDEEAASTDDESDPEDPTVAWCPPIPDAAEDPSEDEIFFSVQRHVASARSFNSYPSLLQLRLII